MTTRRFGLYEAVQVIERVAEAATEAASAMRTAIALHDKHMTKEDGAAAQAINKLSANIDEYNLLLEDIRGDKT